MSRMAVVSSYNQVFTSNHLPLWFKHKHLKHTCAFLYERCSQYSHAVGENGRYYHIFLPKLIHKNWSLYVHALKVKSSRLTQAFWGRREKNFWGVGGCLSFNTILGERPTPPSFKPSATHHLMPSCPKPTAPEKQPFFSGQKTLSRVKKKLRIKGI